MRLLLLTFVIALASAAVGSAGTSRVIRSDEWIAAYAVKKDGTLGGAIRVFGQPPQPNRRSTPPAEHAGALSG